MVMLHELYHVIYVLHVPCMTLCHVGHGPCVRDGPHMSVVFLLQHGETVADVRTPPGSSHVDNIRTIHGDSVAR